MAGVRRRDLVAAAPAESDEVTPRPGTRAVTRTYDWHRALVCRVSPHALALALVLSNRMDVDGTIPERFSPSVETLSKEMGYAANSRRGVLRAIRELEEGGFLLVTRGPGRRVVNKYRATVPEQAPEAATDVASEPLPTGAVRPHPERKRTRARSIALLALLRGSPVSRRASCRSRPRRRGSCTGRTGPRSRPGRPSTGCARPCPG